MQAEERLRAAAEAAEAASARAAESAAELQKAVEASAGEDAGLEPNSLTVVQLQVGTGRGRRGPFAGVWRRCTAWVRTGPY